MSDRLDFSEIDKKLLLEHAKSKFKEGMIGGLFIGFWIGAIFGRQLLSWMGDMGPGEWW